MRRVLTLCDRASPPRSFSGSRISAVQFDTWTSEPDCEPIEPASASGVGVFQCFNFVLTRFAQVGGVCGQVTASSGVWGGGGREVARASATRRDAMCENDVDPAVRNGVRFSSASERWLAEE